MCYCGLRHYLLLLNTTLSTLIISSVLFLHNGFVEIDRPSDNVGEITSYEAAVANSSGGVESAALSDDQSVQYDAITHMLSLEPDDLSSAQSFTTVPFHEHTVPSAGVDRSTAENSSDSGNETALLFYGETERRDDFIESVYRKHCVWSYALIVSPVWSAALATPVWHALISSLGARLCFACAGVASALSTLVLPFAFALEPSPPFHVGTVCRLLQGAALGAVLPAAAAAVASWAPKRHMGDLFGYTWTAWGTAGVLSSLCVGLLAGSIGALPAINMAAFFHAVVTLLACAAWALWYRDEPHRHPLATGAELNVIYAGKSVMKKRQHSSGPPYVEMVKCAKFWSLVVLWLSFGAVAGPIVSVAPAFYDALNGTSVGTAVNCLCAYGLFAALALLTVFLVQRINLGAEPKKAQNLITITMALITVGCFLCYLSTMYTQSATAQFGTFTLAVAFVGCASVGAVRALPIVAKHRSRTVAMFCATAFYLGWALAALLALKVEGGRLFLILSVVTLASGAIFIALFHYMTPEPAKWASDSVTQNSQFLTNGNGAECDRRNSVGGESQLSAGIIEIKVLDRKVRS